MTYAELADELHMSVDALYQAVHRNPNWRPLTIGSAVRFSDEQVAEIRRWRESATDPELLTEAQVMEELGLTRIQLLYYARRHKLLVPAAFTPRSDGGKGRSQRRWRREQIEEFKAWNAAGRPVVVRASEEDVESVVRDPAPNILLMVVFRDGVRAGLTKDGWRLSPPMLGEPEQMYLARAAEVAKVWTAKGDQDKA